MIISSSLNRLSEKKSFTIYENLIDIAAFRNAIPLLYIDYNNLNSRYYKILGFIEKLAANSSDLFFVSLMKYYKNFYSFIPLPSLNNLEEIYPSRNRNIELPIYFQIHEKVLNYLKFYLI